MTADQHSRFCAEAIPTQKTPRWGALPQNDFIINSIGQQENYSTFFFRDVPSFERFFRGQFCSARNQGFHDMGVSPATSAQDRRKVCRFIQKALSLKLQRLREKGRKKDKWDFLNGRNGLGEFVEVVPPKKRGGLEVGIARCARFVFVDNFTSYFICVEDHI